MQLNYSEIRDYLDGSEDETDKMNLIAWFSDLSGEKELRKHFKRYWDEMHYGSILADYDDSALLGRIYHCIKLEESAESVRVKWSFLRVINTISRIAALLFIPLMVFYIAERKRISPNSGEVAYSTIYSPLGTRSAFYLPDGSNGWLNSGSSLRFPTEYRGKSREIFLNGEAYFEVFPMPKKPFIVNGTNFKVTARGTSFDVMAFPGEKSVNITLVKGILDVSAIQKGKTILLGTLAPNQMCSYDPAHSTYHIITVDVQAVTGWAQGKLIFTDEPFSVVVEKINRWYNVDLVIKDEVLKSYKYMGTFEDETFDEVLKLLKLSAPIRFRDLGRKRKKDGSFEKRRIEIYYKP